ncbi:MAG: glycoside hydrolase family 95 protein [Opitutae bacterium]|nr:glycoside hydrolase family 95 protein [Opitutae bacterium]
MHPFLSRHLSLLLVASVALRAGAPDPAAARTLWYRQPAAQWVEALPVGNGRLGAMIFGGIETERLQLNEDTLWGGGPYDPANPDARAALPEIRRLLAAGESAEAQALAHAKFMARPMWEAPYQTVGDLLISMPFSETARNYRRELSLDTATARTEFQAGGTVFVRECFSTAIDQVIVLRLSAHEAGAPQKPARLSTTLAMKTPQHAQIAPEGKNDLVLRGRNTDFITVKGALTFEARVRVAACDGQVSTDGSQLHIENASSVTLLIAAATSYRRFDDVSGDPTAANLRVLAGAQEKTFDALRAAHVADYQRPFGRVQLDLGHTDAEKLPTDERVRADALERDPALAALYFDYARYLLISCSRPGGQPANLQGLWADGLWPPWGSKYTININTEMNYWPAEVTNLAECTEPLFSMIEDLTHTGAKMARDQYGASGWVVHHNTDLWRAAGPIDGAQYGVWPTGGAWLCQHLWEHYLFSGDASFLSRAYPLMKGAAQFFLDTLVAEPQHGWLVTSPSLSPENVHRAWPATNAPAWPGHPPHGVSLTMGPTMDEQIVRDLFNHCIDAARILGRDADFAAQLAATRDRLAPNQIGAQGQLQEWLEDWDVQALEQQHRHVSHLYGFFPSNQITLRGTPKLATAVRKTLETRGDISTGWAIAWRLNLWARQQDGERAYRILAALLGPERTYPNLFDAHPPFQIDGNFGGASGIAEMLLQSHTSEIELLPALPKAWPTGSVRGLRARGGFTVDLEWSDGKLQSATIHGAPGKTVRLRRGETITELTVPASGESTWNGQASASPQS